MSYMQNLNFVSKKLSLGIALEDILYALNRQ